jgi:hypothetical protein
MLVVFLIGIFTNAQCTAYSHVPVFVAVEEDLIFAGSTMYLLKSHRLKSRDHLLADRRRSSVIDALPLEDGASITGEL